MDAQSARIGFIGFGNMASAMAKGFIECAGIEGSRICACAAHFDSLEKRCKPLGVRAFKSPAEVVENCDLVVISVKPYLVGEVLSRQKMSEDQVERIELN